MNSSPPMLHQTCLGLSQAIEEGDNKKRGILAQQEMAGVFKIFPGNEGK